MTALAGAPRRGYRTLATYVRHAMPVDSMPLDGNWLLKDFDHEQGEAASPFAADYPTDDWLSTPVPGDIHPTLAACGRLPADMFAGTNVEECRWTGQREWWFRREFTVPAGFVRTRSEIVFDGIDLYGTVWLNGQRLGETANSFREYRFDVTDVLRPGERNVLVVRVGATLKIIEARPWQKYFACFYTPRIFARKAQCQFSWDWAPHLPALGIWRSVRLESFDSGRVLDVAVRPRNDGRVTFFLTLDERPERQDLDQSVTSKGEEHMARPTGDLAVEITGPHNVSGRRPRVVARDRMPVAGQKNFCTLTVPSPQLWWPSGVGAQPLYSYRVRLIRDGRTHHETTGRFGFREVRVVEEPVEPQRMSFRFEINGRPIFCKGANWVPPSCFPGTVTPDSYAHLVRLAKDANFNILRIWGGGIYEADAFYDACDELGLMVWQDFMFACSDYPDDDPAFIDEVIPEIEHQVRRLRNRPCVVYWCGGNEKTGSAGFKVHYGEKLFEIIIRGVCAHLDPTRPYRPASPHSYTDLGNDPQSGDSHGGSYEKAYEQGITNWRAKLRDVRTVFHSEFGYHGPPRYASLTKFVRPDEIWPISDVMEYHVQDNPYNTIPETFAHVQANMARTLVGDIQDAESFVRCASTFHAEMIRAELEHHRRRMGDNAGAMFWMFDDCWPCASWSVVDYYLVPKPAYYAAARAFAPVALAIIEEPRQYDVYLINDTDRAIAAPLQFGQGRVAGRPAWSRRRAVRVGANAATIVASIRRADVKREGDTYLFARLGAERRPVAVTTFFHRPWRDIRWPDPELTFDIRSGDKRARRGAGAPGEHALRIALTTRRYARMVHVDGVEGLGVRVSDNFFDLMPGESRMVEVRSDRAIRPADIRVGHWLTSWAS